MSVLTRRVQVLLSPDQLARLQAIAQTRGESVGALIREAVETVYLRHPPADLPPPRVAGLHAGAIQISDDFDAPLPDEFWTGTE